MSPAHYALGLTFHAAQKDTRLPVLVYFVIGSQFTDFLWTGFTLVGLEGGFSMGSMVFHEPYLPWSHSLFMHGVWGILFLAIGWFGLKLDIKTSILGGVNVFVHYFFDLLVEDMPFFPTSDLKLPGTALYELGAVWAFSVELFLIVLLWVSFDLCMRKRLPLAKKIHSTSILVSMILMHVLLFLPTLQNAPAVDLTEQPLAILGYTFFLVLGASSIVFFYKKLLPRPPLS